MRRKSVYFIIILVVLSELSCSNTKYSGVKQYYSNFVSYYNTYFNISNRYKVGYRTATQSAQENTSDFISVFEYENDAEIFKSAGQFSETAPKLNKLLALRPYNKWIDDALLVEGKIRYLRGEYDSAQLLLQLVTEKYPKGYVSGHLPANKLKGYDNMVKVASRKKEPIRQPRFKYHFAKNEASIWLIKTLIKRKQYDKALTTIIQTDEDFSFPLQQRKHLIRTRVMYYLAIEDFRGAKEQIEKFFELQNSTKKERGRMRFLLAQIAEKQNDNSTAAHEYTMALKETLSPDLEFEAKLKSLSFNSRNPDEAVSSLRAMLRKGSNISNLDKIYLALGNVYLIKKDEKTAIKNYKLGVESCKTDSRKFVMYEKIAQTYYQLSNYLLAANYYDSANTKLPENYPNKKEFARKTEALKKLLKEYNLYYESDSILELASLGEDKAIEKIAKQIKKERNAVKAQELQKETSLLADDAKATTDKNKPASNTWYFEDKELVEKGKLLFQRKWGKLSLQDNWRRASPNVNASNSSPESKDLNPLDDIKSLNLSPEDIAAIEVKRLPFSESKKISFMELAQQGLIGMARIYHYDIQDLDKAIETYELLYKKYPKNIPREDEVLYSLYRLYIDKENLDKANDIKSQLTIKFPNSKYALYAINPNAKSNDEKAEQLVGQIYKKSYLDYSKGQYEDALAGIETIELNYSTNSIYPKALLLKAFIYGASGQSAETIKVLNLILTKTKDDNNSEDAKKAADMLQYLNGAKPASRQMEESVISESSNASLFVSLRKAKEQSQTNAVESSKESSETASEIKRAEEKSEKPKSSQNFINYHNDKKSAHAILYKLNPNLSSSAARTIAEQYLRTLPKAYLAEKMSLGTDKFISILSFSNFQSASEFHSQSINNKAFESLLNNSEIFFITTNNLDILYISMGWKEYQSFYEKNYR